MLKQVLIKLFFSFMQLTVTWTICYSFICWTWNFKQLFLYRMFYFVVLYLYSSENCTLAGGSLFFIFLRFFFSFDTRNAS